MVGKVNFPSNICLVGAGKMGSALLESWVAEGFSPQNIVVYDPHPSPRLLTLQNEAGLHLNPVSPPFEPSALLLAIKPQMLEASAQAIDILIGSNTVLVSILAGKTIKDLGNALPHASSIVRTMPNLPASIGHGATGAIANSHTSQKQRSNVDALLQCSGIVEWVSDEKQIDAVTAISGSGPAYVFYMTECLTAAAIALGLPADLSARLAKATVCGSGTLMQSSDLPPATLRENVTSPGGTTAAALNILMAEHGLKQILQDATMAAEQRARELAG